MDQTDSKHGSFDFFEPIEKAYQWSSQQLLQLVFQECKLIERLESIKHYFFLDRGDFFIHFFDNDQEDIFQMNRSDVTQEKVESYLEMAIKTSSCNSDPFKDDVTGELSPYGLIEQLYAIRNIIGALGDGAFGQSAGSGQFNVPTNVKAQRVIECFTLDYKVKWPLTLILSRKTLTKYQLIFRHLIQCKYVERQLQNSWVLHQTTKELNVTKYFIQAYALRNRMLNFIKNFVYYMTVEVLEPNFHKLKQQLMSVQTFDEVITLHDNFLDNCLKECLLTSNDLFQYIHTLNQTSLFFSSLLQRHHALLFEEDANIEPTEETDGDVHFEVNYLTKRRERLEREEDKAIQMAQEGTYSRMVDKFLSTFNDNLKKLLGSLAQGMRYEQHISNLATRLDYNMFYQLNLMQEKDLMF